MLHGEIYLAEFLKTAKVKTEHFTIQYCISVLCVFGHVTHTVASYSSGNELVVYEISIHVLPTELSPTTTHLMSISLLAIVT